MTIYVYTAKPVRIIDGDTIVLAARQLISWHDETIVAERTFVLRLLRVDSPERKGETKAAGDAALLYVRSVLFRDGDPAQAVPFALETDGKKDVYGRLLGTVRIAEGPNMGRDLSNMIVESGHGIARDYSAHMTALMGAEH